MENFYCISFLPMLLGNKSYRSPSGSWFVQTFCKNLWNRVKVKNLDEIIRVTQFEISKMLDIDRESKVVAQVMDKRNDSMTKTIWLCPKGISSCYCVSFKIPLYRTLHTNSLKKRFQVFNVMKLFKYKGNSIWCMVMITLYKNERDTFWNIHIHFLLRQLISNCQSINSPQMKFCSK